MDVSEVDNSQFVVVSRNCDSFGSGDGRSSVDVHVEVKHLVGVFVALALQNESAHLCCTDGGTSVDDVNHRLDVLLNDTEANGWGEVGDLSTDCVRGVDELLFRGAVASGGHQNGQRSTTSKATDDSLFGPVWGVL